MNGPIRYSISRGTFTLPDGTVQGGCYAGGGVPANYDGSCKNSCAAVGKLNLGPLPFGVYTLSEMIAEGAQTGPNTIYLDPDEATEAYIVSLGREPLSFRIHGDSIATPGQASEGCIIAPAAFRLALWASPWRTLIVVP